MWPFRQKAESAKLCEHKQRRREVEGCVQCGTEVQPGKEVMVCGVRFDRWTLCMSCYKNKSKKCATPMFQEAVAWEVDPSPAIDGCTTASAALKATFNVYCDRPCLGFPSIQAYSNNKVYQWLSYRAVLKHAVQLGSGLKSLLSKSSIKLQNNSEEKSYLDHGLSSEELQSTSQNLTVLIYAEASVEWYLMHYACILEQFLVVPILDGTPKHQVKKIIERCHPAIIMTSAKRYKDIVEIMASRPVCNSESEVIILLLSSPADSPYPYQSGTIESKTFISNEVLCTSDVAALGQHSSTGKQPFTADCCDKNEYAAHPRMLIPTSGSSGDPKLIMITDAMMMRQFKPPSFGVRTVMYSFQPIRQSFDTLIKGGQIGLWSGDLGALHEDMIVLRPTHFSSTPVFWLAQLQQFNAKLQNETNKKESTITEHELYGKLVKKWKEKRLLGNRCRTILVGGAPSSLDLKKWIWDVFGSYLMDGYGTSETGAIATNEVAETSNVQLTDVPSMGYMTSDKPYPRGEIVAFTKRMTPGYYNDPVANKSAFMEIGDKKYFRTGDIGMLVDGKLVVIDRKKALFKLSNGKFVAPAPLETLFSQSPLIKQALVYGYTGDRSVNAVIVLTNAGKKICSQESEAVTQMDPKPILKECTHLVIEANREPYEVPQHVILSTDEWTVENGCLTSSLKPCRPVLLNKYVGVTSDQQQTVDAAITESTSLPKHSWLSAGLEQVMRETVPFLESNNVAIPSGDCTLFSLGIDSLALAILRSTLHYRFGIDIPITQLAGTTLNDLNSAVLGGGVSCLPDVDEEPESLQAEANNVGDLFEKFQRDVHSKNSSNISQFTGNTVRNTVLLTGVTGFVGAFLFNELLQMDKSLHILCLVRAADKNTARERVQSSLKQYLLHNSPERWSVVVGDLADEKLGLETADWEKLVQTIHSVYHAGTIVNASLPLPAIRATNITGTKTIVELCVAAEAFLHHVSSISVLPSGITAETLNVPPPGKSATAYAKSKWIAEQIVVHGAHKLMLKARIYRLGTMSCHSVSGACNSNDTFTRIVQGIIELKAYTDEDESMLPKLFYLAPIDWAVKAFCALSLKPYANVPLEQVNKNDEAVQVAHILNNNFLLISTVFDAIIKYGIPLVKTSTKDFKIRLETIMKDNAMYTFRDIFIGGSRSQKTIKHISTEKLMTVIDQCPEVDEQILLKMLSFLSCRK